MEIRDDVTGDVLALEPVAYQYPAAALTPGSSATGPVGPRDWFDRNWLMIYGTARCGGRAWEFEEPALLADEARDLAPWLRRAASGKVPSLRPDDEGDFAPDLAFVEPDLGFGYLGGAGERVTIRAFLWLECAPRGGMDFWMDLTTTRSALRSAADAWDAQVALFPVRDT